MIDEHADELISHGFMNERSRDGGIDAAAHRAQHLFISDLFFEFFDLFRDETAHRPISLRVTNFVKEVFEDLISVLGMRHFGVELNAVNFLFFVRKCGYGAGARFRVRKDLKSGGRLGNIVGVAHPADALFGDVLKELSSVQNADLPFSVLARRRMSDFAAQRIGNQLTAVANAEDGDSESENFRGHVRRRLLVNAIGTARKNDADGIVFFDLLYRHIAAFKIAVNV